MWTSGALLLLKVDLSYLGNKIIHMRRHKTKISLILWYKQKELDVSKINFKAFKFSTVSII